MRDSDAETRNQIIETVTRLKNPTVTDIVANLPRKRSRQWVSTLLNKLALDGLLIRTKVGKNVRYVQPSRLDLIGKKVTQSFTNKSLNEDLIFEELKKQIIFLQSFNEDLESVVRYAFTEMLNNAIEHSGSKTINVTLTEENNDFIFEIRDFGIGAFRSIMGKKKLSNELEAIQELSKGKTTTLPHSHSGEGIFFTSKLADLFVLDSFEYRFRVDNMINDFFVESIPEKVGTNVYFIISKNSKKHLNDVFKDYESEPGSYSFDKTKVYVKLFKAGTIYISRSQARRLITNLDKFKVIVLDFKDVKTVGQAFADEVFRVFAHKHADIEIKPINMEETVEFMVKRALKSE